MAVEYQKSASGSPAMDSCIADAAYNHLHSCHLLHHALENKRENHLIKPAMHASMAEIVNVDTEVLEERNGKHVSRIRAEVLCDGTFGMELSMR